MRDSRYQLTYEVESEREGQLLRDALGDWGISKRTLTAIKFDGGLLLVNGIERNVRHPLTKGDAVTVIFPPEEVSEGLTPEEGYLQIVYEDDAILIVDKPPYQSTIPSREHPTGSIANVVAYYLQQQELASTVHIVNRLDRDTSGLMCIAKHRHIHHLLSEAQKQRGIYRTYEAIVHGHVLKEQEEIIAPIGRKDSSIIEREVRMDGQFAHTDVFVVRRFMYKEQPMTHVRLALHTGRTHQIRVHMAHIGHSLVGDELYGGQREFILRQALHCVALQLKHPLSGELMTWSSGLPTDMAKLFGGALK